MQVETGKNKTAQCTLLRFWLIVVIFIIWFGAIGIRLVYLQVDQHDVLRERAISQRRDRVKKKMLRGTIYDSSGRALAMSVKAKSAYVNPQEVADVQKISAILARVFKLKQDELAEKLTQAKQEGRRFFWIARKIAGEEISRIKESLDKEILALDVAEKDEILRGFYWQDDQRRVYPLGSLAAHVIGFANVDDVGQAGVEMSQEDYLHGAIIRKWQERDRLGRVYESEVEEREPPKDVYLTLVASIQYKVESALKEGVESANAKSGTAIVMDPKTGEILAMANYPNFDPNNYSRFSVELFTNRAIHTVFSPGSTFKAISYSAALDKGLIAPDGAVDCGNGLIQIADRKFHDSHCKKTYAESIAVSSNIAAIRAVEKVGKLDFFDYIRAFGFGEKTGIELPAESAGLLALPDNWSSVSLASIAIGYEIGVTAIQLVTAFSTIANDGVRLRPYLIKEIHSSDGNIFKNPEQVGIRVIKPETAKDLKKMLQGVVLHGTGKLADPDGYTVAGKTGTAWKYDERLRKYNPEKYVSSFVGFAPVERPAIVVAVIIDEPRVDRRNGGDVAAPVFRKIIEQVLPEMQVSPDKNDSSVAKLLSGEESTEEQDVEVPFSDGMTLNESNLKISQKNKDSEKLISSSAALSSQGSRERKENSKKESERRKKKT
ncbi:MAG: penicillin-binding protein 2 [Acidobacteria bacterium]|nr:MAG: penicillin-binding protein 2 [Acidobacteriota bacterium]